MAYNAGFPATYQPLYTPMPQYMQQPQIQAPQPQQAQTNGLIWVQGEAGAKSFLVAPNNTVQLWDSESQTIYLKSADASGMPTMKILDYTIRDNNAQQAMPTLMQDGSPEYVTKAEFEAFKRQMIKEGNDNGESAF